jgi:hypothetical protein
MLGFFDALILLAESSPDIYIKGAVINALGEIDSPKARAFLQNLTKHPEKIIRDKALAIMERKKVFNPFNHTLRKERRFYETKDHIHPSIGNSGFPWQSHRPGVRRPG